MRTHDVIDAIVEPAELAGVAVFVIGGALAAVRSARALLTGRDGVYESLRRDLGRVILIGLELLIVADIIRTITIDTTPSSVVALAGIVAIRTVLSFSLHVELEGSWPWSAHSRTAIEHPRETRSHT